MKLKKHTNKPLKYQCKPLTIAEVNDIIILKEEFQKPMKEVLHTLQVCDDECPINTSVRVLKLPLTFIYF